MSVPFLKATYLYHPLLRNDRYVYELRRFPPSFAEDATTSRPGPIQSRINGQRSGERRLSDPSLHEPARCNPGSCRWPKASSADTLSTRLSGYSPPETSGLYRGGETPSRAEPTHFQARYQGQRTQAVHHDFLPSGCHK